LYDADGKRTWKFSGTTNLLQINGQTVLQQTALNKTLYVNPYMIITESNYTKHYFMESERVATKNGSGFSTATIKPWDSTLTFIIGDADSLGSILDNIINRQAQCTGDTGTVTVVSRHFEPVNNNNEFEKTYFYHPDHLGSASFITHMDGHPMQHLQYLPYGELFVSQSFKDYGFDSRYKFAAKERDEETGYDYFGARYYDNEGPIWLSVDPMSDSRPNLSPYNYCQWNPVGRIDPDGAFDGWVEDPDNPNAGVYWDPKINSESEAIVAGKTYRGQTVLANDAKGSFRFGDETGQWHDVVILDEITVNAKRYDQNNGIGLWGNARQEVFDWGRAKQQENPMTISDFQLYDPVKDVLNFIAGKFINWWLAPSSTPNSSGNRAKNINKKSDSIVEISTKKYIETIKPNGEIIKEINPQYNKVIGKHKRISNDETDTIYLKYLK
ncbi:MAG: RHS repeat-associated core domain-containing protein, partial [Bacteroidales bacterium]|nr:RHS repeat-associated core domain-containing protein [Bacteroidales bacterium]